MQFLRVFLFLSLSGCSPTQALLKAQAHERTRTNPRPSLKTPGHIDGSYPDVKSAAFAARDFLREHKPQSKRFEYAGCIYRERGGEIRIGAPVTVGQEHICEPPDPPTDSVELMAEYHNHPNREVPSAYDRNITPAHLVPQYIFTPSGRVLRYDPRSKQTEEVKSP